MPDAKNNLYLYEALELRAEYDARIKELKGLIPEARETRGRLFLRHDEDVRQRPAAGFRVDEVRDQLNALGIKKRKLNAAIQKVNFDTQIATRGDEMSLSEALDLRKTVNAEIGELSAQLASSAYERVVYKEERDIVEAPERSYEQVQRALDDKRLLFRQLNRSLRAVAHDVVVEFKDEP